MGKLLVGGSLILTMLIATACAAPAAMPTATPQPQASPTGQAERRPVPKTYKSPPSMAISADKDYKAVLRTNMGDITIQLLPKEAPLTVNNFVFLAKDGYYDGVVFHRVIKGFMIQTGDPTGSGAGGPGYRFPDEPIQRDYEKGVLAMANAGPNTNGSQFFITQADLRERLPKNYTIFGTVTGGLDVVDKIAAVPVKASPSGEASSPTVDVHIDKVTIEEK